MEFKERLNLLFHKSECIRVRLYDDLKTISSHIVRVKKGSNYVEVGERKYLIDVNNVYIENGVPTLTYHISSANSFELVEPNKFRSDEDTSKQLDDIMNNKIVRDLQRTATEQKMTIQSMLMLFAIGIVLVLGIAIFFVYREIQDINEYIDNNRDVIDLIKDYLLRNGG